MKEPMWRGGCSEGQWQCAFNRRRFLRGLGASIALPAFESLLPARLLAADAAGSVTQAVTATGAPLRFGVVYFPNGAIQDTWWPTGTEREFQFARTMKPLEPFRSQLQVLAGLDHLNATTGTDGFGDHARAAGTFLTGVRVRKTAGADIRAGVSIDQVLAQQVGHLTRFPSLELSCDAVRKSGDCDAGYSCAYQFNLAWRSPTTPMSPECNPRWAFERLFGDGLPGQRRENLRRRQARQISVLDFVIDETKTLQKQLGVRDRQKLDEFLVSVREVEQRIGRAENLGDSPDPVVETPAGIPTSYEEHLQLMFDLLVLAFQTDSTRIATLVMAQEQSNRSFPEIGAPEGHHHLSHHLGDEQMIEKVSLIDLWYVRQFSAFLARLAATRDVDGNSLLHNSMILYGGGNADGNGHTHDNLPIILAGGGGGSLSPGRYVRCGGVPLCNLFLNLADRMGAQGLDRFGDSTARLGGV
ncbi:MAG: DUF1552 domain-containing protein [Planctomycetaceae bacterium]